MPAVRLRAIIFGVAFLSILLFLFIFLLSGDTCPPSNTNLEWDSCIVRW
jgi:hypothetical protein